MNILVISSNYPSPSAPQMGTFVYNLIQEFVTQGNKVVVISPKKYRFKNPQVNINYGEEAATVLRPKRLSFSNKKIGSINTFHLTNYFQVRVIRKAVKNVEFSPDLIYCHFLISAITYLQAFPDAKTPVFVAVGEYHNIDVIRSNYSKGFYDNLLQKIRGFIAVSPLVHQKLISMGVPSSRILLAPNGTDLSKFKPGNKSTLRANYNLPLEKKIVLFVGRFLENKGPLRVQKALDCLGDDVVAVFIGKGPQVIDHPKVVFCGAVAHNKVADFMALSDVFVLPTLHEGSSNVIVEAMASGLPIVSSDLPEIKVQCDESFSVLVDPTSVGEIAAALNTILRNDVLRLKMSKNALVASKQFDVRLRARNILSFIRNNI